MIWIILNIFVVVTEVVMYCLVSTSFFRPKLNKSQYIISFLIFAVSNIIIVILFGDSLIIKITSLCIIGVLWTKLALIAPTTPSIFVSVFFNAYIYIADACLILMAAFFSARKSSDFLSTPPSFYLFTYLAKCIELILILLFRHIFRKKTLYITGTLQDWLRTSIFPLSTLFLWFFIVRIYFLQPDLSNELLICTLILLLSNFASVFIIERLEDRQLVIHQNEILQQSLKKEQSNLAMWSDAYQHQRKQTHDFQNHLLVIHGLLDQENTNDDANTYINNLLNNVHDSLVQISTHRSVVDILISQKYTQAQKAGIHFDFQLDDLSGFPLPDDALTVVLANLLDNAINACSKVEDPTRRQIKLKIDCTPACSFLYIENCTDRPIKVSNNLVVNDVDTPRLHGFGMQNIRAILDRYDTDYFFDYSPDRQVFIFSAQFFPN